MHLVGIVIKYENMDAKTALHYAAQILSLTSKASKYIRDVFDSHTDVSTCDLLPSFLRKNFP